MRNVSDKRCRENQNARLMFNDFSLKMVPFMKLKNMVQPETPQMIIQHGACTLGAV